MCMFYSIGMQVLENRLHQGLGSISRLIRAGKHLKSYVCLLVRFLQTLDRKTDLVLGSETNFCRAILIWQSTCWKQRRKVGNCSASL